MRKLKSLPQLSFFHLLQNYSSMSEVGPTLPAVGLIEIVHSYASTCSTEKECLCQLGHLASEQLQHWRVVCVLLGKVMFVYRLESVSFQVKDLVSVWRIRFPNFKNTFDRFLLLFIYGHLKRRLLVNVSDGRIPSKLKEKVNYVLRYLLVLRVDFDNLVHRGAPLIISEIWVCSSPQKSFNNLYLMIDNCDVKWTTKITCSFIHNDIGI